VKGASPVRALERVGDVSQLLHTKTRTKVPRGAGDVSQLSLRAVRGRYIQPRHSKISVTRGARRSREVLATCPNCYMQSEVLARRLWVAGVCARAAAAARGVVEVPRGARPGARSVQAREVSGRAKCPGARSVRAREVFGRAKCSGARSVPSVTRNSGRRAWLGGQVLVWTAHFDAEGCAGTRRAV